MLNLNRIIQAVNDRLHRILRRLARWWCAHQARVAGESGYAEALTDALLTAVDLLVENWVIRYLAQGLASAYVWLVRRHHPTPRGPQELPVAWA